MERSALNELLSLAAAQHQLVSVAQAGSVGVSPRALRNLCDRGWFRPVRRGIVAVAGTNPSVWEPLMAAALAAGPFAVISHLAAANIHRFSGIGPSAPELTVPQARRVELSGVRVYRSQRLDPVDTEQRHGVRLTTPVRTVIDIAGSTGDYLLGKILDDGTIRRLWTPEVIACAVDRLGLSGRAGAPGLKRLLDIRMGEGPQDAELEQRVLRALRKRKDIVPDPVVHHRLVLADRVIDMDLAWPQYCIDGEIDGYLAHSQRSDFDRDRLRANLLEAHGWRLVRWTSVMDDDTIVAQVAPYFGIS